MSELIVEMEMPTVCDECPMLYDGIVCAATGTEVYPNRQARILKNGRAFDPCENRLDDCPIVGVLPDEHGDLIDRDVLYMAVKSHNTSDAAIARNHNRVTSLQNLSTIRKGYIAEKHICLDDIIRAEAVIKAERKDDGTTVD